MSINRVVINSSPLIVLFKSQQAELLPQLFQEILVPEAVWHEITAPGKNDLPSRQLPTVAWAQQIKTITVAPEVALWDLGKGESEVLSLALNLTGHAVIIDDRAARRCARSLGLITIGTGRVLLLAKQRGLIPSIRQILDDLIAQGTYISQKLYQDVLTQAQE